MNLQPAQLLTLGILSICLGTALANRRSPPLKRSITDEDSAEKKSSLFGTDDDDGEGSANRVQDDQASSSSATPSTNRKDSKPKPRQITLPDDYDRLLLPTLSNVNKMTVFRKWFGAEQLANWEAMGMGVEELEKKHLIPGANEEKLHVLVEAEIRCMRELDEINEEITVELDFIVSWIDLIIAFENQPDESTKGSRKEDPAPEGYRSLDPEFLKRIWKPDLFIENIVSITRPELITKPIRLLFNPDGKIILSTRVTIKMDCEMEFYYYPADTQHCVFRIRSYSYTKEQVELVWDKRFGYGPILLDPNDHNFDVKLDMLDSLDVVARKRPTNDTETFKVLQFQISARRKLSYHLIQTYLPSTFFIFITWLSFLVPATMVEARIGISMTTLLTLTSMFASVRESTPTVSYVKAIDTWMVACIFFVFLTLLEFTVLTWRRHSSTSVLFVHENEPAKTRPNVKEKAYDLARSTDEQADSIELERLSQTSEKPREADTLLKGIPESDLERYGFMVFFCLFMIFNLVYWPWLLISSAYWNWEVDPRYNAVDVDDN